MSAIKVSLDHKDVVAVLGLADVEVAKGVASNIIDKYLGPVIREKLTARIADIINSALNDLLFKREYAQGAYNTVIRAPYDKVIEAIMLKTANDKSYEILEKNKDLIDKLIEEKLNYYVSTRVRQMAKADLDAAVEQEIKKLLAGMRTQG